MDGSTGIWLRVILLLLADWSGATFPSPPDILHQIVHHLPVNVRSENTELQWYLPIWRSLSVSNLDQIFISTPCLAVDLHK